MAEGKHPMHDNPIHFEEEYHDFIGLYEEAVDPNLCDWLCEYIDKAEFVIPREMVYVEDRQICLDTYSPQEAKQLMQFVNNCLGAYVKHYPYLTNFNYISSLCLMQKTEPMKGYHIFHGENLDWNMQHRTMAWIVYLNTLEKDDGGETEWLYQQKKISPKRGTVCIWPGGYSHLHRGNPPMKSKYVVTGWYQGSSGLAQVHTAGLNDPNSPNYQGPE